MVNESVLELNVGQTIERTNSNDELVSLFQRLSHGEFDVLERVYDLCARQIYGLALWRTGSSDDAADVVQEVFVRLAASAKLAAAVRKPQAYLLQIAHRVACELVKSKRRELQIDPPLLLPDSEGPENAEYASRLSGYLQELPAEQREALYLRYFTGLSFREIARATDVSIFTVTGRCRLGLQKLKRRFGGKQ